MRSGVVMPSSARHLVQSRPERPDAVWIDLQEACLKAMRSGHAASQQPTLNRWLQAMREAHPPPPRSVRRIKLRYMTQARKPARPGFVVEWRPTPDK